MGKQARVPQYSIRGISSEVDGILRQKAAKLKQSLNQVILDVLSAATVGRQAQADFSDVLGQWTPDPAFDEVLAAQRRIDRDKWK